MREKMVSFIHKMQDEICDALSVVDGAEFHEDRWTREEGGGGRSRVIQNGNVFEKGGVNVSEVHGVLSAEAAQAMAGGAHADLSDLRFFATGISMVLHPHNPMAPTVHLNYRYFERGSVEAPVAWWFGGGADLTPSYLFEEDARHFHQTLKQACDDHSSEYFPRFKEWCDRYFSIPHRGEARGVGGIFFDNLNNGDPEDLFAFVQSCLSAFLPSYMPILERRKDMTYTPAQKEWQAIRRGRYVEFNLVYDRGTRFGLHTKGRIESILMSLPVHAQWHYDHQPEAGSEESRLLEVLGAPQSWV